MSDEFINDAMRAAGERVLLENQGKNDLKTISEKVFRAMIMARETWRANHRDLMPWETFPTAPTPR